MLVVADPGLGVGSGGASLNALLVVAEHLAARAGHTTLVPDLLSQHSILILHLGPALLPLPAGLLYCPGPGLPTTNLARTAALAASLVSGAGPGLLVAGTDIFLAGDLQGDTPGSVLQYTLHHCTVLCRLAGEICLGVVRAPAQYAAQHGVVDTAGGGTVTNIRYQPRLQEEEGERDILAGLVWFSPAVAESLLRLHCQVSSPMTHPS